MSNKICPSCGENVSRRKRINGVLSCPSCHIPLKQIGSEYVTEGTVPPTDKLTQMLIKKIQQKEQNIFPYVIPEHKKIRTRKILKESWLKYYPVMEDRGLDKDYALHCYSKAIDSIIDLMGEPELGLILWYISGKETNVFQKQLTKNVRSLERVLSTQAEKDNWL